MRTQFQKLKGDESMLAAWNRNGFKMLGWMDGLVSVPAWLGAYQQAVASGVDEDTAVRTADRTVRTLLMTSHPKDIVPIQRKDGLMKLLTMFMGDASSNYNMLRNAGHNIDGLKGIPTFTLTAALIMAAGVLGELIKGQGPDDDEDPRAWAARKALLQPFQTVPVLRDGAAAVDNIAAGKPFKDYRFSPALQAVQKVVDSVDASVKFSKGDMEFGDWAIKSGEAAGFAFGVAGTAQVAASAKYLKRYHEGEEQPANAAQLIYDTTRGKRRDR
mgnify:CR=1 FL=1